MSQTILFLLFPNVFYRNRPFRFSNNIRYPGQTHRITSEQKEKKLFYNIPSE